MDKIKYVEYIEKVLQKHANFKPIGEWYEYENQIIIDQKKEHFQLMRVGWKGADRMHHCVIHIDLKKDGKIWVQEDRTEAGVANELVDLGVPKEEIVLAFYAPFRREDTEFAAA